MKRLAGGIMIFAAGFTAGIAAVPAALDPVRTAPHIYSVEFENDRVRVLRAMIRNGETPPLHSHPDRVRVFVTSCAWLEKDADGNTRMQSYRFGEVTWAPAESHGGVTASVVQDCNVLEIELKPEA